MVTQEGQPLSATREALDPGFRQGGLWGSGATSVTCGFAGGRVQYRHNEKGLHFKRLPDMGGLEMSSLGAKRTYLLGWGSI